jgi:hypothetical protein
MKHFKDIREGLLKGQSNTLAAGESAAEAALKEQMMQYFLKDGDIPRNKKNSFIRFVFDDDIDRDSLINKSCSFDGSVITVDLTKLNKDTRIKICTFNGGADLPQIKIIDKRNTTVRGALNNMTDICSVAITSYDKNTVDVTKFIHPDTNVSSVGYDRNGIVVKQFKSNEFPGTVRDLFAYDCDFEKINKNKFPNCQLWFSKTVLVQTFLNTIGKPNAKYELGYPTANILI